MNLGEVLLALSHIKKVNDTMSFYDQTLTIQICDDGFWSYIRWDLTKSSLEEQSDEVKDDIESLLRSALSEKAQK